MNKIVYDPNICYIVEVWYKRGGQGDIAIATICSKELPKEKNNQWGFTKSFWNYESAIKYARHVAVELGIPFPMPKKKIKSVAQDRAKRRKKMKKAKVIKSYYLENSYGCFQLVKDGDVFLVGWNALSSVNNPDWGYSVRYFSSLEEAEEAFNRQYLVDKSWGRAI